MLDDKACVRLAGMIDGRIKRFMSSVASLAEITLNCNQPLTHWINQVGLYSRYYRDIRL